MGPCPDTYRKLSTTKTGLYNPAGGGAGGKINPNAFILSDGKFSIFIVLYEYI
jgi:hypothetical protein